MGKVYAAYHSSGIGTPESVLVEQEVLIKKAIANHLARHPELKDRYLSDLETQRKIDALKAAGKKVPLALVANPFLRVYYQKTGRGE
jgi:serine/threonine-protein kinase RIO1